MVDKLEAKNYIAEKIGEQYIVPLIGVWDKVENINFDILPEQFVLKCTHDSGGVFVCKDKKNIKNNLLGRFYLIIIKLYNCSH